MADAPTTFLTVDEAAKILACSTRALRSRIARREIPFTKLGRRVLIPTNELGRFLEGLPAFTAAEALDRLAEGRDQ